MTTLNQAFIRVYARQPSDVSDDSGSQLSGPLGVQLRVDAGATVPTSVLPGMGPNATASGSEGPGTAAAVAGQVAAFGQPSPLAVRSGCLGSPPPA